MRLTNKHIVLHSLPATEKQIAQKLGIASSSAQRLLYRMRSMGLAKKNERVWERA